MSEVRDDLGYHLTADQLRAQGNLTSDATHIALGGGSRSGKTWLFIRAMLMRACHEPGSRHLVARFRFNAAKTAVGMDTIPKVLKMCFPYLPSAADMLDKTDWMFVLPNGSEIWITGLDEDKRVEKVLGHEYCTMFFNECSQIPWKSVETSLTRLAQRTETLKLKAYYDLNPPSKMHWSYRRFIEKRDPETGAPLEDEWDYSYLTMNPEGNAENLAPGYLDQLKALGERARARFLHGQFSEAAEGALWDENLLAQNRILGRDMERVPPYLRIVIAVDPSGAKGKDDERSDEIGIMVGALGRDGHGYLLEDLTVKAGPEVWGQIVGDAWERHQADRVVAEVNFGGDMVRHVIQAYNPDIAFDPVTASRGKIVRAEPISALYEQGKIHHIGYFPELEEQMCAMTLAGYTGLKSPDRADSLVWLWTALFPKLTKKDTTPLQPPRINLAPRSSRSHQYAQNRGVRTNTSGRPTRRVRKYRI